MTISHRTDSRTAVTAAYTGGPLAGQQVTYRGDRVPLYRRVDGRAVRPRSGGPRMPLRLRGKGWSSELYPLDNGHYVLQWTDAGYAYAYNQLGGAR